MLSVDTSPKIFEPETITIFASSTSSIPEIVHAFDKSVKKVPETPEVDVFSHRIMLFTAINSFTYSSGAMYTILDSGICPCKTYFSFVL